MENTAPLVENEAEAYEILEYNFFKASVYLLFMSEQHEMLIRTTTSGGIESIIQFTDVIYDKEDISKTEVIYGYAFRLNGKSMDVDPFFHALINMKIGWEVMTKYFEFWDNFIRNKLSKPIDIAAADIANFEPLFAMALDQIFSPIAALEGDVVTAGRGPGPGPEPGPRPKPPQGVHKYIPSPIQKIIDEPPIPDTEYHEGGVGSISHEQQQEQRAGPAGQIGEIKQQKPKTKNIEEGKEETGKQQEGEKAKKKKPERHEKEFEKPSVEGEGGEGKGAGKGKSKKGKPSKGGKGGGKEEEEEEEEEKQPLMLSTEQLEQLIEERKELRANG